MRRRDLLRNAVGAGAGTLAAPMVNLGRCRLLAGTREYRTRTLDLVGRSLVVDMLGQLTLDWERLERWHSAPASFGPADRARLESYGVTVFHPAVELHDAEIRGASLRFLSRWSEFVAQRADGFVLVRSGRDLVRAKRERRTGILLGLQNSRHFECPADVATFHAAGQRVSQLTYDTANRFGCGCFSRPDSGLTEQGAGIVEAMNLAGMGLDLSHSGEVTCLDAIAASNRPVLVTHANCRALAPHPRCKSDQVIRAMARKGGVIGLTGIRIFVGGSAWATLDHMLDHFDHVARIAGVEHIGIGTDSDPEGRDCGAGARGRGVPLEVDGFNGAKRIFDLVEGLWRRRYSDAAIEMILGANVVRVLDEILPSDS